MGNKMKQEKINGNNLGKFDPHPFKIFKPILADLIHFLFISLNQYWQISSTSSLYLSTNIGRFDPLPLYIFKPILGDLIHFLFISLKPILADLIHSSLYL